MNLRVRLNNQSIILAPLAKDEVDAVAGRFADTYVLYRKALGESIQIGIPSMEKYFPGTANVSGLDNAIQKAYFYCGGSSLKEIADEVKDRPVYEVLPTDERTIENYRVINGFKQNGSRVLLEKIFDESYQVEPEKAPVLERTIFRR